MAINETPTNESTRIRRRGFTDSSSPKLDIISGFRVLIYFLFFMRFFFRRFRSLCLFIIFLRRFNVLIMNRPSSRMDKKFFHHVVGLFAGATDRSEHTPGESVKVAKGCLSGLATAAGDSTWGRRIAETERRRNANIVSQQTETDLVRQKVDLYPWSFIVRVTLFGLTG